MPKAQNPTTEKPLACGGKGPCCHIGYAHRHCEHCDMVISLHQCSPVWWNAPYGNTQISPLRPPTPWYSTGTALTAGTTSAIPLTFDVTYNPLTSAASPARTPLLSPPLNAIDAHVCEVPGA